MEALKQLLEEVLDTVSVIEDNDLRREAFSVVLRHRLENIGAGSPDPGMTGEHGPDDETSGWRCPRELSQIGVTEDQVTRLICFDSNGQPAEGAPLLVPVPGSSKAEKQRNAVLLTALQNCVLGKSFVAPRDDVDALCEDMDIVDKTNMAKNLKKEPWFKQPREGNGWELTQPGREALAKLVQAMATEEA